MSSKAGKYWDLKIYLPHSHPFLQLLGIGDFRGTLKAPVHLLVGAGLQKQNMGRVK